jgi:endogenous inhibitor of DNA gyrase (YacG/DUF329 family)
MTAPKPSKPANSNKACPICGTPVVPQYQPFCSARCADVDLHRWLGGVYRVETDEKEGENPDLGV